MAEVVANIFKALTDLARDIGEAIGIIDVVKAWGATAIPTVPRGMVNVVRGIWWMTRAASSASGLRQVDAEAIIRDVIRATSILQDAMGVDAEFITETLEEAFSNAAMAGLGGAFTLEAGLKMGMYPLQQLATDAVDGEFDAQTDVFGGVFWVQAVRERIAQLKNAYREFHAVFPGVLGALQAHALPTSILLRTDPLLSAAEQIVANFMDAVNALNARIAESYSAYVSTRILYERGLVTREDVAEMEARLVASLDAALETLAVIEDAVLGAAEALDALIDEEDADEVLARVDDIMAGMAESMFRYIAEYMKRLFNERVVRPDAGISIEWATSSGVRRGLAYRDYNVVE